MKWLFACLLVILFSCNDNVGKMGHRYGEKIPSINLMLLDSISYINTKSLNPKNPVIMFFFDPECPYCQAETRSIFSKIEAFNKVELCFISVAPIEEMRRFRERFKLSGYNNVHFGIDTGMTYLNHFEVSKVPHNSVYSRDKRLRAIFPFGVDAKQLLSEIK